VRARPSALREWSTASRLLLLLLLAFPLRAAELEGVTLEDRVQVDGQELQLNGMALRTRVIFRVYVAGLYLPSKTRSALAAIAAKGAKRIVLVMMRDANAEQFVLAIEAGLRDNHSEAQLAAVKAQTDSLLATIRGIGQARRGMHIVLDYFPSQGGTQLFVDGPPRGRLMPGEEFFRALLRIWLGDKPVQDDLKKALLGG
ncbi:MAG: chalcone isomerase family protein, partial [Burkholderiales bacterium]